MLVFISDLHFRDRSDLTVPSAMTKGFLQKSLIPQIHDAEAKEVEIVFLGDLFDINRSQFWVDGRSKGYKPWTNWKEVLLAIAKDKPIPIDPGLESAVLGVLQDIRNANRENYEIWRAFKRGDSSIWGEADFKPQIRFHYLPGNHDRLSQYSPAIRNILVNDMAFDHESEDRSFDWIGLFPDYSVIALHGHQFDNHNFGGKKSIYPGKLGKQWYLLPPLGDFVTVTIGVETTAEFAREIDVIRPPLSSELVKSLAEIDLVRPNDAQLRWAAGWRLTVDESIKKVLDRVVIGILKRAMKQDFVRLSLPWYKNLILIPFSWFVWNFKGALRLYNILGGGYNTVEDYTREMVKAVTAGPFADWLGREHKNIRYIVSGHTHAPIIIPLNGNAGQEPQEERIYFNTGTWQDIIEEGRGAEKGFARRHQIAHVVFFKTGEEMKANNTSRSHWEFWQGSLRTGSI